MKKTIKSIGTIATMEVIAIGSFYLGTRQEKTITAIQTITEIKKVVPDEYINTDSEDFYNNYIDMRQVTDFTTTKNGLQIYLDDGSGYYWER